VKLLSVTLLVTPVHYNIDMSFTYIEVKDKELLNRVFAFRYKIISQTKAYESYYKETTFQNNMESDKYDKYSIHFAVLNENNDVCASVRLIHNSAIGYPTENDMTFDNTKFEREKLGELSRIFINQKCRNPKATKELIHNLNKLIYIKMMKLKIEYTYGALEPNFLRLLKIFKMPYEILGERQNQGKMGLRYPCILYTKKLAKENQQFI